MIPLTDHMKIVGMDETTSDSDFRLLFLHAIGELDAELPPHLKLLASIIDSDQSKLMENRERKIENARERRRRYSAKFKSEKDASERDGTPTDASERDGTPTDASERDGTLGNAFTIPYHTIPTIPTIPTNRSVHVVAEKNDNLNGTGCLNIELMPGGVSEAKRLASDFAKAVKSDQGAFFAPEFDAVTVCAAVTGDFRSLKRWRQLVNAKGEDRVREETFTFWREISAGEDVNNRGAALNNRLAKLPDKQEK